MPWFIMVQLVTHLGLLMWWHVVTVDTENITKELDIEASIPETEY